MSSSPQQTEGNKRKEYSPADPFYGTPNVVLFQENQWGYIQRRYRITSRELEVVKLVCHGLSEKEIAGRLRIEQGTVKTHTRNIYRKIRVRNKISMLLTFMNDVSQFYNNSNIIAPLRVTDGEQPNP